MSVVLVIEVLVIEGHPDKSLDDQDTCLFPQFLKKFQM